MGVRMVEMRLKMNGTMWDFFFIFLEKMNNLNLEFLLIFEGFVSGISYNIFF